MSPDGDRDLSHRELMDQLKADIAAAREAAQASAVAAEERDSLLTQRVATIIERLDSGSYRFQRLEAAFETMARDVAAAKSDRREIVANLDKLHRRISAVENARAIVAGVDEKIAERVSRWRRWAAYVLLLVFGNGMGMSFLIWWLERHPPPG